MSLIIDSTISGSASNCYVSLASSLVIAEENIHISGTFSSLSTNDISACLIYATSILDQEYDWVGDRGSTTQKLRWPRNDVYDPDGYEVDSSTIPDFLQRSCTFLAYALSQDNRIEEASTYGFKQLEAGSLNMVIDKHDRKPTIPYSVWNMVKFYCTRITGRARVLERI